MFTYPHHRFTRMMRHERRETATAPEHRKRARRMLQIFVVALITTGLIGGDSVFHPAIAAAQAPMGYERWTNPNAKSGVDFGLSETQVFQNYAASLHIGMPVVHKRKDKRLIDIEVRADGSGLGNYVYDVVWVLDEGNLALESWFVPAFTEAELHQIPQLAEHGIVAVDIERYPKGEEWRFAAILQRNAGKFGWDILTDVSLGEVTESAARRGLRVLDLDYAHLGPLECPQVQGQACSPATFDAILVANSGSNAINTKLWLNMTPQQIAEKQAQGFQVIDAEYGTEDFATVWVKQGLPFELQGPLTANEVTYEHGHQGRVVDLEYSPTPYSIVNLAPSAAPGSPKLARGRQDDTTGGKHQVKPRDEKAKAKRDRKAKDKKADKRGKNGKARRR